MSQSFTAFVTVEVEVTNCDSESEARRIIFASMAASQPASKGRPTSGPKASVTGVTIAQITNTTPDKQPGCTSEKKCAKSTHFEGVRNNVMD